MRFFGLFINFPIWMFYRMEVIGRRAINGAFRWLRWWSSGNWPIRRSVGADSCYHTITYLTIPNHTIPYHTISYNTIWCHTIPYHTIPYHTVPHHTGPYHQLTAATASPSSHSATDLPHSFRMRTLGASTWQIQGKLQRQRTWNFSAPTLSSVYQ